MDDIGKLIDELSGQPAHETPSCHALEGLSPFVRQLVLGDRYPKGGVAGCEKCHATGCFWSMAGWVPCVCIWDFASAKWKDETPLQSAAEQLQEAARLMQESHKIVSTPRSGQSFGDFFQKYASAAYHSIKHPVKEPPMDNAQLKAVKAFEHLAVRMHKSLKTFTKVFGRPRATFKLPGLTITVDHGLGDDYQVTFQATGTDNAK